MRRIPDDVQVVRKWSLAKGGGRWAVESGSWDLWGTC